MARAVVESVPAAIGFLMIGDDPRIDRQGKIGPHTGRRRPEHQRAVADRRVDHVRVLHGAVEIGEARKRLHRGGWAASH
jgi:plasmid stabilization system protein ParE